MGQRGHRAEVSGPQGRRVGGKGVIFHRLYCPHGGRVRQRGVSIHRNDEEVSSSTEWTERGEHPPRSGGARSTGREGATERGPRCGGARSTGREGATKRCHPPRSGGARSTGREGGTEVPSSREQRCTVHREGGWDGGAILQGAEMHGPQGGRVRRRGVNILLGAEMHGPQGGRVRRRGVNILQGAEMHGLRLDQCQCTG